MHTEIIDLDGTDISGGTSALTNVWVRKLHFLRTRICIGTPEIKATSFLLDETRTPICHSFFHPGGIKALLDEKSVTEDKQLII